MLDHVTLQVSDLDEAIAFYEAALAPLGYSTMHRDATHAGLWAGRKPDLWLAVGTPNGTHLAFAAADEAMVQAFYAAGLAAGGRDNGAPGPRPLYHARYYGAFVLDPDGNNIEAVFHGHVPTP